MYNNIFLLYQYSLCNNISVALLPISHHPVRAGPPFMQIHAYPMIYQFAPHAEQTEEELRDMGEREEREGKEREERCPKVN